MSNDEVVSRVLGEGGKSIDNVVDLQLRWSEHVLRIPNHRLREREMFSGVGVRVSQTNT